MRLVLEYGDLRQKDGEARVLARGAGRSRRLSEAALERYEAIVRMVLKPV